MKLTKKTGFLLYGGYAKSDYEVTSLDNEDLYSINAHRIVAKAGISFEKCENFSFGANFCFYDIISCQEDYDKSAEFVYGPSGGLRLYLPQVNLPAMSIEAAYNIPKNYMQFVMSLGISL